MRLKDACNINSLTLPEQTSPNYRFRYIDISNVDSDGNIVLSDEMYFRDAPSRARRIIKEGDTIISTVRTYLKAIATVNFPVEDVIVSTGFAVCSPYTNVFPNYLAYSFRTDCFIDEVCKKSTGVSYPAITASALSAIEVPYCNERMQSRIVTYLDTKTAAIDKRIAVLEKKQEVYSRLRKSIINRAVTRGLNPNVPLKDSGVDWIGMIPEHWEVRRMKDVSYMYSGLTGKSGDDFRCEDESVTKPFIPFTNILNNTKVNPTQVNKVVMTENEDQNVVKKDDLLFLMSSEDYESIAKSAVVEDEIGEVYLNSFCRGLRPTTNDLYPFFLNYELQSSNNRDALRFEARGFTRINIKVDRITSHFVVLPPLPEQRAIADYLNEKCAKIDAAVENINKQVDALKRLKRALINEVVTGKRKV